MRSMERKLLLLGLLRNQEMHGYQLNEVIDSHLGTTVFLKKSTAYDLLKKMAEDGWITSTEEHVGNRPPRRVYAITPAGEQAFQHLLRECLATYKPAEFPNDISLAFLDAIPADEALSLLQQRRRMVEELLDEAGQQVEHPGSMQLVLEHQRRYLAAESEWLDHVIAWVSTHSVVED